MFILLTSDHHFYDSMKIATLLAHCMCERMNWAWSDAGGARKKIARTDAVAIIFVKRVLAKIMGEVAKSPLRKQNKRCHQIDTAPN